MDANLIKTSKRAQRILNAAKNMAKKADEEHDTCMISNYIEAIQLHDGYADPGCPEDAIVATGNWNDVTKYYNVTGRTTISDLPSRVMKLLEKVGVECEWCDEWCDCSDCGKLCRTEPDCYWWKPSYVMDDNGLHCNNCREEEDEGNDVGDVDYDMEEGES